MNKPFTSESEYDFEEEILYPACITSDGAPVMILRRTNLGKSGEQKFELKMPDGKIPIGGGKLATGKMPAEQFAEELGEALTHWIKRRIAPNG